MNFYAKKDLPAQKNTSRKDTRLPEPEGHKSGEEGSQGQKTKRPLATDHLKTPAYSKQTPRPLSGASSAQPKGRLNSSAGWGGKRRIRSRREFNELYAHGNNLTNSLVVLKFLANQKGFSRAAFSVGKRLGKAAARNSVKRLMREALKSLTVKPGWDLLFLARSAMMGSSYREVTAALKRVLERAGLL